jgi:hypothetical protein
LGDRAINSNTPKREASALDPVAEGAANVALRRLEFCGLVGTLIIDEDGIYDPRQPNDRLLLGMKARTQAAFRRLARRQIPIVAMA